MASPLQIINSASPSARRKLASAVTVYAPGRGLPAALTGQGVGPQRSPAQVRQDQAVATIPYAPGAVPGKVDWNDVANQFINSPEAQAQRQGAAQKAAEDKARDGLPFWKRGLGVVLNNPVTQMALAPLQALSVPMKAVTLGREEAFKHAPEGVQDWITSSPLAAVLGGPQWGAIDEKKVEADTQGNWSKLAPRSDYGANSIYKDVGDKGRTGAFHLGLDVLNDPLTYISGGVGAATKGERAAQVGELALRDPGIVSRLAPEFQKGIQKGFGTMSPEAREALDLGPQGLKLIGGAKIPGTGPLGKAQAEVSGALRSGVSKVGEALPNTLQEFRTPENLVDAFKTMRSKSSTPEDILLAATHVAVEDARRLGEGAMKARGMSAMQQAWKSTFKGQSETAKRALVDDAERGAGMNRLNELFSQIAKVHEGVTGRPFDEAYMLSPDTYVPHILDPKFRRFLDEHGKEAAVQDFKKATGIVSDDLLETSGYLDQARKLAPDKITGQPVTIKLGGQDVVITDGTINGLNETLQRAFPGYSGRIYMDDPVQIGEAYVRSLAKDAGTRRAFNVAADSNSPLAQRMTGEINDVRLAMNESLSQQPEAQRILSTIPDEYTPGMEAPVIPPRPRIVGGAEDQAARELHGKADELMASVAHDPAGTAEMRQLIDQTPQPLTELDPAQFFKTTTGEKASADLQARALQGREFAGEMGQDIKAREKAVRSSLTDISKGMTPDLVKETNAASKAIKGIDQRIKSYASELRQWTNSSRPADLERLIGSVEADISELEQLLKTRSAVWKGKITKESNQVDRALYKNLRSYKAVREEAEGRLKSLPRAVANEIRQRTQALNAPVEAAQRKLANATDDAAREAAQRELDQAVTMRRMRAESIVRDDQGQRIFSDTKGFGPGESRHIEPILDKPQPQAFVDWVPGVSEKPVRVPPQRTEEEALGALRSIDEAAAAPHRGAVSRARTEEQRYAAELPARSAQGRADVAERLGAQRDAELGPIEQNLNTMKRLDGDLVDKQALMARRDKAEALIKRLKKTDPSKASSPDLIKSAQELADISKTNALLDPLTAAANESLLLSHMEELNKLDRSREVFSQTAKMVKDAQSGKLPKIMVATLHDGWKTLHDGLVQEGDAFMARELYNQFMRVSEIAKEPGLFGRTFNAMTNLFKTYATLSPGFHVRNAMSGIFMNTADGVGLSKQLEAVGLWKQFRSGGEEWLSKQEPKVQQAFEATFGSGAGGRFTESGVADAGRGRAYNIASSNKVTRGSQKAGEWVEGPLRLGMALDSMEKGQTVSEALQRISRVHFDYSQVSKLDESMKRFIPFWTFMSRNLPLQVQMMYRNPRWYSYYDALQNNFSEPDEEFTPGYWKKLGSWNTGLKVNGMPLYVQPDFGFTRVGSDLDSVARAASGDPGALLSNVNPLIAAPIDYAEKRDSFYDRTFTDKDYSKMGGPVGAGITALASVLGQTNEAGQVNDNFFNLLTSINPVLDRTSRMAPGIVGGESDPKRVPESVWRYFGVPLRTLSPQQQQSEALRRYLEARDESARVQAMNREAAR